ncbi:recombinase family protein [Calothrix sp. UHCC 0171]|uniref:recombinase family protein n=1 Tax=Calothrix sp. UHCC 0171 TaxID=3110245 RepID=UPI002B21793B|nr:recombinase family protein [Calothrix sp. UHCC 0171]MEA5572626.1 recombinase family protein [Calothrix sp. UHCC 0171]
MTLDSLWIVGPSRCGKTTRLVEQFCIWVQGANHSQDLFYTINSVESSKSFIPRRVFLHPNNPGVLMFAANSDNQRELNDKIMTSTQGKHPIRVKTPLGFFQDEVILYFPLLVKLLNLKAQFPVRLRPETEQELATKLWKNYLTDDILRRAGVNEYRLVRRILDLLQLAALSGTACEEIGNVLATALQQESNSHLEADFLADLLLEWRNWCLQRGFLSYGIITELYSQHLLPNPSYQQRLVQRYQAILADDVGDYPAIARNLFEVLLDQGVVGAFSYNPDGVVRLGLGADPKYVEGLAARCEVETLTQRHVKSLGDVLATPIIELITEPMTLLSLPDTVQSMETMSRALLLRQTAEMIVKAVKEKLVEPKDIVIIAPGLDAIARYSLVEILSKQNIFLHSLNDQRPLIASPIVRALLTLVALVYPGLGRWVDRDAVAEMLVVLSRGNLQREGEGKIDPVRAGIIADYCFVPHPDQPDLLAATAFDRWDRLGFAATTAYGDILQWIQEKRGRVVARLLPSPISLIYTAIEKFFLNGSILPYDQLAVLRELLETAQHYWEIDTRLRPQEIGKETELSQSTIAEFIQLLRRGTVSANPYPMRPLGLAANAVTLATIFQYRASRKSHKWHFWLDIGSPLWAKGGAATLFGANIFLRDRLGQPWTAEDETIAEHQRIKRILADLLARVSERLYLCHSELAVNGQEQLGPLLPLVNACVSVVNEAIEV